MSALLLESVLERFKDQEVVNIGFSGSAGQKVSEKLAGYIDLLEEHCAGQKGQVNILYTNGSSPNRPHLGHFGHLNRTHLRNRRGLQVHSLGADGGSKKTALNGSARRNGHLPEGRWLTGLRQAPGYMIGGHGPPWTTAAECGPLRSSRTDITCAP